MHKLFYLIFLIGFFYSNNLFSQEKYEKESRIKLNEVPQKALLLMDSLKNMAKINWYKEEGLTKKTIEAKFKRNKTKYSIEFDTLGNIEDIEIEVDWLSIESHISNSITKQLKIDCSKQKIVKIQKQYNENDLFFVLRNDVKNSELKTNYELIVRCNEHKEVNLFEYLFNEEGIIINKSKIIFENSTHLEY